MHSKTFGNGRDIVFLHGWGGGISSFFFVAKRLAKTNRVTLFDFPSFGETAEPTYAYTIADFANEVLRLMDKNGISSATLVGHSFGGRVALELAAKHKERVSSLVLVDSAGLKPRRGLKYYSKFILHKILKKLGLKGLKGSADYSILSPTMKLTFKNVVNYDQTELLSEITQPTAIFWGKEDTETPPYMAKKMNNLITNSDLFWLKGGHFAYIDDSAAFIAILSAFVNAQKSNQITP